MRRLVLFSLLLVPEVLPAADVAVLEDGSRVPGRLDLARSGQLVFVPQRRGVSVTDAVEYRLEGVPSLFRAGPGMLLRLSGGQQLSGVFLGLERDALLFRTAWADRLTIPRPSVVSLTHLPGQRTVFAHDLTGKLTGWAVQGTPVLSSTGVVLARPGQALTCTPSRISTGRVEVNFRTQAKPAGARWVVEALFARKGGDRVVRVTLAGSTDRLAVDPGGLAGTAEPLASGEGWRRLYIDFSAGSLRLSVDDEALWYTLAAGPGGPLRQVRLACLAPDRPAAIGGSVELASFVLQREAARRPHPPGDSTQDELWLGDGDQLFGQVVRADREGIELKGRFGIKRYAWTSLRGWFPRQGKGAVGARSPTVRLGIRSGLRAEVDTLDGTLTALDTRRLTLRHAVLGDVALERTRVAWVRPVSAGR
jgi:hypothetical protein